MDHFATAVEAMEHDRSSPEDHEMASAPVSDEVDMRQPRTSSSEDVAMTSAAQNSHNALPFPYPSQQNWGQSYYNSAFTSSNHRRSLDYYQGHSRYSINAAMLRPNPFAQAAPPPPPPNNNPIPLQYGHPQQPVRMLTLRPQQPTPGPQQPALRPQQHLLQPQQRQLSHPLDPFEPLPFSLPNAPNKPFTPSNIPILPLFLKERGTSTFTLPGSLLHVAGLLYPNATFTITLTTANVPMRVGGDGLAKFSQLLPASAHNEKYHIHLVFRDWPAGQVAEFPDDAVARKYVERMEEVISPMPGLEVWYYDRFVKVTDDGEGGECETGEKCWRVLRGFRAREMGPARAEEVLEWMRGREGRVKVDESGGRVIEFATGLYFAPVNQRISEGWVRGTGSVAASTVDGGESLGREKGESDTNTSKAEETKVEETKKEETKAEEKKVPKRRGPYKRRRSRATQASEGASDVTPLTSATSAIVADSAQVDQKVVREGLRPRSGRPVSYAKPWWAEKKDGQLVVDLDAPGDEEDVEVKVEEGEEEAEDGIEDEVMDGYPPQDEIYDYDA